MSVQLVTSPADLRDIVPAWDVLARHSLEPNVFYESWMLLAALEQFSTGQVAVLLAVSYTHLDVYKRQGLRTPLSRLLYRPLD